MTRSSGHLSARYRNSYWLRPRGRICRVRRAQIWDFPTVKHPFGVDRQLRRNLLAGDPAWLGYAKAPATGRSAAANPVRRHQHGPHYSTLRGNRRLQSRKRSNQSAPTGAHVAEHGQERFMDCRDDLSSSGNTYNDGQGLRSSQWIVPGSRLHRP